MTASRVVSTGTSCLKKSAGADGMLGDEGNPPEKLDNTKRHTLKAVSVYQSPARGKTGRGFRHSLPLMMRRGSMTPQWKTSVCLNTKQTRCLSTAWTIPAPLLLLQIRGTHQTTTPATSLTRKTGPRSAPLHYGKAHTR